MNEGGEAFWKLVISWICLMNCLMQIHSLQSFICKCTQSGKVGCALFLSWDDLERAWPGSFRSTVLGKASHWTHPLCCWKEDPRAGSRNDKVQGQPEPPPPAWSPLNLAWWLTSLEAQSVEGRGPAGGRLTNCITIAWDVARFPMNSWLQNTGWWASGAVGSRRGKNDRHLKSQHDGEARACALGPAFWLLAEVCALQKNCVG